jgi:O-antigen/teichoic acid export membrane protein
MKKGSSEEMHWVGQEGPLAHQVTKGGLWVFAFRGVDNGLRLIKLVILARVLAPNDFGLFGIALLAMSTLETFSQTGFQTALVQKKGDITRYLDTAWTVFIMRSAILFALLFFSAPHVALFFNTPDASPIIKVIGVSILLAGFTNIGIVYFQKEMEFDRQFIYQLSVTLVDLLVVIAAALAFKNVWAFVFGLLAGNITGLVMSYVLHPYRPHFRLDLSKAKVLFGFGKWVFWSSILIFLVTQGDDVFVGKFLGVTMLGFYQMAYRISNMPATEITHVISQVTFPAYSKMQDDLLRLREAYLRVLQLTAFLAFPMAGLIFVLAPEFTKLFLGEKWMPIVPAMQVLCIFGIIRAFNATTGSVFQAVGRPSILTKVSFIQLLFLAAIIYQFTDIGKLVGISLAVTLANFLCFVLAFKEVLKITKESKKKLFIVVLPSLLITFSILFFCYLIKLATLEKFSLVISFAFSLLTGLGVYLIYAKFLGFSFSNFINSGSLFNKRFTKM